MGLDEMTVQQSVSSPTEAHPELDQLPQLYAILSVLEQMVPAIAASSDIPSEAKMRKAFLSASGVGKAGFLAMVEETCAAAAAGAGALLNTDSDSKAAAEPLAEYLHQQIIRLGHFLSL